MSELHEETVIQAEREPTRRGLLRWLWWALGLGALAEVGWISAAFLRPRGQTRGTDSELTVAGAVDDFAPGSVTPFPAGRFFLVRLPDGGFLALCRECTHLGCSVPWRAESGRFECPCHASAFDLTGAVLRGANLEEVNLRGAVGLTAQQLDEAGTLEGAILPRGVTQPTEG